MPITINMNPKFKWLLTPTSRWNCCIGGAGSGKSYSISLAILILILQYNVSAVIFRKVHRTHKLTTKRKFEAVISENNLNHLFKVTRDNITCLINNCTIDFLGLDDSDKIKSLDGFAIAFIEEGTELEKADYKEINRRIRGKYSLECIIYVASNPDNPDSYLKTNIVDFADTDPNITAQVSTFEDNPYLDEAQKNVLRNERDEWHRKVYSQGIWASLNDAQIFDMDKLHIANISHNDNDYDIVLNGFDAGFTHAAALMRVGIKKSEPDNLYIIDEVYLKNHTHKEFIEALDEYGLDLFIKDQDIACDSEDPAMIKEFVNSGYHRAYGVSKFKNITQSMIDYVRRYNIIVDKSCVNFIREYKTYHWKKNKGVIVREPVKLNDDSITAVFYALLDFSSEFRLTKEQQDNATKQIESINNLEDPTVYIP